MPKAISERHLREAVVAEVQRTRDRYSLHIRPVDLISDLQLQLREAELPQGKDGAYLEGEKTILINRKLRSGERRTFTLYHEITHHLIRAESNLYSELHDFANGDNFDRVLEVLCNVGAAEFLLPGEYVREVIRSRGFSLGHLKSFCEDRGASIPAAAIQLAQYAAHHCYIVVCESGIAPINSSATQLIPAKLNSPSLYIVYTATSTSAKYSIARYTVISKSHLIHEAHSKQTRLSGEDNIPFRSGKEWKVPCEAMYFKARTVAIFNVTQPMEPSQPSLF